MGARSAQLLALEDAFTEPCFDALYSQNRPSKVKRSFVSYLPTARKN